MVADEPESSEEAVSLRALEAQASFLGEPELPCDQHVPESTNILVRQTSCCRWEKSVEKSAAVPGKTSVGGPV